MWWGYVYLLGRIHTLSSGPSIVISNDFQEGTFATDSMANWACTYQTHQRFFSTGDLPSSLFGILDLDDLKFSHVRIDFVLLVLFFWFVFIFSGKFWLLFPPHVTYIILFIL